ncbi:MAG: hypothetical protein WCW01_06510 [Gammaproteobacteria bacterium]
MSTCYKVVSKATDIVKVGTGFILEAAWNALILEKFYPTSELVQQFKEYSFLALAAGEGFSLLGSVVTWSMKSKEEKSLGHASSINSQLVEITGELKNLQRTQNVTGLLSDISGKLAALGGAIQVYLTTHFKDTSYEPANPPGLFTATFAISLPRSLQALKEARNFPEVLSAFVDFSKSLTGIAGTVALKSNNELVTKASLIVGAAGQLASVLKETFMFAKDCCCKSENSYHTIPDGLHSDI